MRTYLAEPGLPMPTAWILSALSLLTLDPSVQAFLERQSDLLELARRHTAAGERVRDAGVHDGEISQKGMHSFYSVDEMWMFDLGTDLIAWLADVDGIAGDD